MFFSLKESHCEQLIYDNDRIKVYNHLIINMWNVEYHFYETLSYICITYIQSSAQPRSRLSLFQ